jgi:hypothetical protein
MKAFFATLLCSLPALAYNEAIHGFITSRAISGAAGFSATLQPPTQADLDAFRKLFAAKAGVDLEDSYDFKQFLMLNPTAVVHGFDLTRDDAAPMTRGELLAKASRWPDDDLRNQHRYFLDSHRQVVKAANGAPMPYDPATLDFGGLTGVTSQGHAHYGLVNEPLSDDPEVLKKEPWRFAIPPTAHAVGPEFVRIYTELAQLALQSDIPSREWLAATFAGAAMHHLEDLCNQIHTVQVGIYEFFQAAFLQSKLRDVKTLGGLFGRRYSLKQVGLRLVANHHLLSEDWFAKRVKEGAGIPDLSRDDPDIRIDELPYSIIARSSREGAEAYKLAWTYSAPSMRDGIYGHAYSDNDDPDRWVASTPEAEAAKKAALALSWKGIARAATAVRLEWRKVHSEAAPDLKSEAAFLTGYHAKAAQRRAAYVPTEDVPPGIAWGYPAAALIALAALALLIVGRVRR